MKEGERALFNNDFACWTREMIGSLSRKNFGLENGGIVPFYGEGGIKALTFIIDRQGHFPTTLEVDIENYKPEELTSLAHACSEVTAGWGGKLSIFAFRSEGTYNYCVTVIGIGGVPNVNLEHPDASPIVEEVISLLGSRKMKQPSSPLVPLDGAVLRKGIIKANRKTQQEKDNRRKKEEKEKEILLRSIDNRIRALTNVGAMDLAVLLNSRLGGKLRIGVDDLYGVRIWKNAGTSDVFEKMDAIKPFDNQESLSSVRIALANELHASRWASFHKIFKNLKIQDLTLAIEVPLPNGSSICFQVARENLTKLEIYSSTLREDGETRLKKKEIPLNTRVLGKRRCQTEIVSKIMRLVDEEDKIRIIQAFPELDSSAF